jgi:predicted transcriptional regulator
VLLRKSDSITGASRNYLENLKIYLQEQNQVVFTSYEVRRKLRLTKTTQWRYHQQLLENNYLKKVKRKNEITQYYEITNPNEYKELEEQISQALEQCITQISSSTVQPSSTTKTERLKKTKPVT